MKHLYSLRLALVVLFAALGLSTLPAQSMITVTDTIFDRSAHEDFGFGADISWVSQQESWGTYYLNKKGRRTELFTILQDDYSLNAVRFRVWVNPAGGWSGKQDVINLCKRAHQKGMKIMISFHYSDIWADSGSQTIPGQWTDHSADGLANKVYEHTYDILSSLKALGITPKWVSLGNETKQGMLYEIGRTNSTQGIKNFVKFINKGYDAVKAVDSTMITIIHLPNAHDESTARKMFDNLKTYGANYDCIGLSAYPRWSHLDVNTDASIRSTINTYMTTFRNLKARFNKPIMVMETGHYASEPYDANRFLSEFMKALIDEGVLGCFYWEPEAFDNSGYNLGAWSSATHQATIAMDAYLGIKHSKISNYGSSQLLPLDKIIYEANDTIQMGVKTQPSHTLLKVDHIDYYLNDAVWGTARNAATDGNYYLSTDTLHSGAYKLYAVSALNQGSLRSDTTTFLVGPYTLCDEQCAGYAGINNEEKAPVSGDATAYGSTYFPGSQDKTTIATWNLVVPQAGDYQLILRFRSTDTHTVKLAVGSSLIFYSIPVSPKWSMMTKKVTIAQPGNLVLKMQGMNLKGYPDVDFVAICPPEGGEPIQYGDESAIESISIDDPTHPSQMFDLLGRRVKGQGKVVIGKGSKTAVGL